MDVLNLLRPTVLKLKPYASAKDEFKNFDQDLIFLDANENPYDNGWNRYPDPNQTNLKILLSKIKGISEKNMLLGNGSDEILDMIFRIFCEPNQDNVIINKPTFGMYKVLADINNISCKEVLLTNDFQLDKEKIISAVDQRTKLIFICNPNNPTGNLMKKEDVFSLVKLLNVMVVIDEAYIDFTNSTSWLNEVKEHQNLIVTQTLSKAHGMAGLRLGICYANEQIIDALKKIKMPYNVNILSQSNAISYLEQEAIIKSKIDLILKNKKNLKKELLKINFINKVYSSDTNFFLVQVDDADKRYNQLLTNGIVVRNRNKEPLCKNCLRITVGTEKEIEKLIETFKELDI